LRKDFGEKTSLQKEVIFIERICKEKGRKMGFKFKEGGKRF